MLEQVDVFERFHNPGALCSEAKCAYFQREKAGFAGVVLRTIA